MSSDSPKSEYTPTQSEPTTSESTADEIGAAKELCDFLQSQVDKLKNELSLLKDKKDPRSQAQYRHRSKQMKDCGQRHKEATETYNGLVAAASRQNE